MKKLLVVILFFQVYVGEAQVNRKTFPLSREFKKSGFSISPLATVSFGNNSNRSFSTEIDVVYNFTETGRGTWNGGLELGFLKFFEGYKVGDYFEAAISYRRFSGVHYLDGELKSSPVNAQAIENLKFENRWQFQTVTASARMIDIAWQKPKSFVTWGFGLNYNYLLNSKIDNSFPAGYIDDIPFEKKHAIQGHFQLGYAFKITKYLLLIPTVETPIISVVPTSKLNPSISFLGVNYYPLIISIKLMILRKDPVNCNAPRLKNMPTM